MYSQIPLDVVCFNPLQSLKVATLAVSLGGVETLVCHPASTTHHNHYVSPETKKLAGITDNLVRLRYIHRIVATLHAV